MVTQVAETTTTTLVLRATLSASSWDIGAAIGTLMVAVATAFLAYATWRMAKGTGDLVKEAAKDRLQSVLPVLIFDGLQVDDAGLVAGAPALMNAGPGPALGCIVMTRVSTTATQSGWTKAPASFTAPAGTTQPIQVPLPLQLQSGEVPQEFGVSSDGIVAVAFCEDSLNHRHRFVLRARSGHLETLREPSWPTYAQAGKPTWATDPRIWGH